MILTCCFTVNVRFYVVTALKLGQFVGPPHEAAVMRRQFVEPEPFKELYAMSRRIRIQVW